MRMRRMPLPALVAVAVALAMLWSGCGGSTADTSGTAASQDAGGTPQRGGTLILVDSDGESLDASVAGGILSAAGGPSLAVYDTLVYEAADTGEIVPRLAKSITTDDGVTWDVKLRSGVRFSDGTPFDAAAVKFNWERIANPKTQAPGIAAAQSIASMTIAGPLDLRVKLKAPNGQFPRTVAQNMTFIGSPTAIKKSGARFGEKPVGAGPFVLQSMVAGSQAVYVRNSHYWDAPRPYVDKIIMKTVTDPEQRYNTIASGEANLMSIEAGYDLLSRAQGDGLLIASCGGSGGFEMPLNLTRAPFDDPLARRALAAAIDRSSFSQTVMGGAIKPFTSMFATQSPFYDAAARWPAYDPQEAQRLLDEYAQKHGGPLTFKLSFPATFERYGQFLQTQLAQYKNVSVKTEFLGWPAFFQKMGSKSFDAGISVPTYVDPAGILDDSLASDGARNYAGYRNPEMDKALQQGHESLDLNVRKQAYAKVQQLAIRDLPLIWLTGYGWQQLHTPAVHDVTYAGGGAALWYKVWMSKS